MHEVVAKERSKRRKLTFSQYYNSSQLRADTWNRLKHDALALAETATRKADITKLRDSVQEAIDLLEPIEGYWAFPGHEAIALMRRLLEIEDYRNLALLAGRIVRALSTDAYRRQTITLHGGQDGAGDDEDAETEPGLGDVAHGRPYFEVLVVDAMGPNQEAALRQGMHHARRPDDPFTYELLVVRSFEDAMIAVLTNYNIQTVVIRFSFPYRTPHQVAALQRELLGVGEADFEAVAPSDRGILLCEVIGRLRPELCVYLVTDVSVEEIAGRAPANCLRVFYRQEDFLELHLNILRGVHARYQTPFFTALKDYSRQPTGVFHAMPISRGKSITKSHWIQDMGQFYGMNIFLAETSATSGGLDSLLEPTGPIKKAQQLASRAPSARSTPTSSPTAPRPPTRSSSGPGQARTTSCWSTGTVTSRTITGWYCPARTWSTWTATRCTRTRCTARCRCARSSTSSWHFRRAGKLDRVKALLLTNCTFDGIVYNVQRVMEECLAIKPDLVFFWDEAWFAFARCGVTYRQRTGMASAATLRERYRSAAYREAYAEFQRELRCRRRRGVAEHAADAGPGQGAHPGLRHPLDPQDADRLRQGSMIHVYDQDFQHKVADTFHEAYMTHTSTSPNYQILASLDVGRRQVELEGFELVKKQLEMAMVLREKIVSHPTLSRHFRFLTVKDMIPPEYRKSGIEAYYEPEKGWTDFFQAWRNDEFVLDPTRLTLFVGLTGVDGNTFKNVYLMDKYGIQINKTSRNTVLFMTNIGTTRSSVAYLIEVLARIAADLDARDEDSSPAERALLARRVHSLTEDLPALPDFSRFHDRFRPDPGGPTPEGDTRPAFFLAYDDATCEYLPHEDRTIDDAMAAGREIVSATFVIPYPPGFPILVPGQVLSREILDFLRKLDVTEIHGLRPELGLRVFTEEALRGPIPLG